MYNGEKGRNNTESRVWSQYTQWWQPEKWSGKCEKENVPWRLGGHTTKWAGYDLKQTR